MDASAAAGDAGAAELELLPLDSQRSEGAPAAAAASPSPAPAPAGGFVARHAVFLAWLAGFLSVNVCGLVYCFPLYAEYFQTLGVNEKDLNVLGNLQQFAAGLFVLPTAVFHKWLSGSRSQRVADFWTALLSGLGMVAGAGLQAVVCKTALRGVGLVAVLGLGLVLNGAAPVVLAHTFWVTGPNLGHRPTLKRVAIASMSLGFGFGGFLFTILISAWPGLTPQTDGWTWLLIQTGMSLATMLLRAAFMYRMGVDEAADVAPPTQVGVWEDLKVRFDKFWWAAGEGSAICVLLFVSVGISIGLLTTVLSVTASLLTTANYGVIGYPTERDVFEAALTFLGCQVVGRLGTMGLQGLGDNSHHVFVGSNAMQLAAFALVWARGGEPLYFIIASALCGIALGTTWTCWPINFGIFFLTIAFWCPVLSVCTDLILTATAPGIDGCEIVDGDDFRGPSCYSSVFLTYTMLALLALLASVAAAALIHRKIRTERKRAAAAKR